MLSAADHELVCRDPKLPGLALLLDLDRVHELLATLCPRIDQTKTTCHYLKYKPATRCLAGYRFETGGRAQEVTLIAQRVSGESRPCPAPASTASHDPHAVQRRFTERWGVTLSLFPDDRRLDVLPRLTDDSSRTELLRRIVPNRPDLWSLTLHCVRYKPERRFVGMLVDGGHPRALIKTYAAEDYCTAQRAAKVVTSSGPLVVAQRWGRSARYRCIVLDWLHGRLLSERISDARAVRRGLPDTGAALAELHRLGRRGLPVRTGEVEARELCAIAEQIGMLDPSMAGCAMELAQRLSCQLLGETPSDRTIHGDFHPDQVLLLENRAALLDLDSAARGEPAFDLGNFLAHLEYASAVGARSGPTHAVQAEMLIDEYRRAGGAAHPRRIRLYTAVCLFRLAAEPFRQRRPQWPAGIAQILRRCQRLLADSGRQLASGPLPPGTLPVPAATAVAVADPCGARNDRRMPWLDRSLEPAQAQSLLRQHLSRNDSNMRLATLEAIQVIRYKPLRRCLLEYRLRCPPENGYSVLIGRIQAKPRCQRHFRLQQDLLRAGFSAESEDRICIPRPAAVITELNMWLQERVDGVRASELLEASQEPLLSQRIADALCKLHRVELPVAKRHTLADEMAILEERLGLFARAHPALRERVARIFEGCARLASSTEQSSLRGIHRDFYADQVLCDGERMYLIDFDTFCLGDPALDVGNFVGHLVEQGLRYCGDARKLMGHGQALIERFLRRSRGSTAHSVDAFTTLTLARHIQLSSVFPQRKHVTTLLMDECERRLGRHLPALR